MIIRLFSWPVLNCVHYLLNYLFYFNYNWPFNDSLDYLLHNFFDLFDSILNFLDNYSFCPAYLYLFYFRNYVIDYFLHDYRSINLDYFLSENLNFYNFGYLNSSFYNLLNYFRYFHDLFFHFLNLHNLLNNPINIFYHLDRHMHNLFNFLYLGISDHFLNQSLDWHYNWYLNYSLYYLLHNLWHLTDFVIDLEAFQNILKISTILNLFIYH